MDIKNLKKALLEVRELCQNTKFCLKCPLHKMDEVGIPYCPMHEDDDGISIHQPAFWVVDDYEEDEDEAD